MFNTSTTIVLLQLWAIKAPFNTGLNGASPKLLFCVYFCLTSATTLYGAGRTKRCQKGARQRFRPQGKARAHGLRARAVETARRGLLAPGRPQPLLRAYQPARSTAARAGLEDLLGAGDDVVLGLAGKHVEEGGIACHPDDQIPVLFRMDLGVQ